MSTCKQQRSTVGMQRLVSGFACALSPLCTRLLPCAMLSRTARPSSSLCSLQLCCEQVTLPSSQVESFSKLDPTKQSGKGSTCSSNHHCYMMPACCLLGARAALHAPVDMLIVAATADPSLQGNDMFIWTSDCATSHEQTLY